jgi:hypothetical protein
MARKIEDALLRLEAVVKQQLMTLDSDAERRKLLRSVHKRVVSLDSYADELKVQDE